MGRDWRVSPYDPPSWTEHNTATLQRVCQSTTLLLSSTLKCDVAARQRAHPSCCVLLVKLDPSSRACLWRMHQGTAPIAPVAAKAPCTALKQRPHRCLQTCVHTKYARAHTHTNTPSLITSRHIQMHHCSVLQWWLEREAFALPVCCTCPCLTASTLPRGICICAHRYGAAKAALNAVMQDRMHHLRDAHPYEPFPIERLARAAATVDIDVRALSRHLLPSQAHEPRLLLVWQVGQAPRPGCYTTLHRLPCGSACCTCFICSTAL